MGDASKCVVFRPHREGVSGVNDDGVNDDDCDTLRWEMPRKVLSLVHTEKHALQKGTPMCDEKLSW